MNRLSRVVVLALGVAVAALACSAGNADAPSRVSGHAAEWTAYGGDAGGSRYSPLSQIVRANVSKLEIAWTYRTRDLCNGLEGPPSASFEATPIVVDGLLYLSTNASRVIALDPESGEERWIFDPGTGRPEACGTASRGVALWLDRERAAEETCRRRVLLGTPHGQLIALDAKTGRLCADFGEGGFVDLGRGIGRGHSEEWSGVTSPPAVIGDLVVLGSAIRDNQRVRAPRGVVRAFHARTGELRWTWDPIPRDERDPGLSTWRGRAALEAGAANVWAPMSVDPERDLVFAPTSSPSPDYYGGERIGRNLYSDSVVALRGSTGELVWHFQTVHHDLWDYDLPAQPTLATLRRGEDEVPVVVQATKMGHLFVLERDTGEPVFPVQERHVPPSDVPGEEAWPTQPFPTKPPALHPAGLRVDEAWGLTSWDRGQCHERMSEIGRAHV